MENLTLSQLCSTETTKTNKQKNQNPPGCNQFHYKLQVRSSQQLNARLRRTVPKTDFPDFSLTNVPTVPSSEPEPKWKLVWKWVSIYEQQTTAEKGERQGGICYVFGVISKVGPAEGWHCVPCPNAHGGGKCSKGPVSGWLGAISRLTSQLNKGKYFFKCNWTLDAPMGCFAMGIPLLWRAAAHLSSHDTGFDIRLGDMWVKERFLSALAGEYTNVPNLQCLQKLCF